MVTEQRREDDAKIDQLINRFEELQKVVNRIESNQKLTHLQYKEVAIPRIEGLENCLYGKQGLLQEHTVVVSKIKLYENFGRKLIIILIVSIGQFVLFAGGYAVLYFKVGYLWKLVLK